MNTQDSKSVLMLILKSMAIAMLGIFFPILYIFFPMLFLTEALEQGILKILLAFVGVCLLVGVLSPMIGFIIFTLFGPLILILHYCITTKKSILSTLAASTAVLFSAFMILTVTTGFADAVKDPALPGKIIESQREVLENMGNATGMADSLEASFPSVFRKTLQILPAITVLLSLTISYVTFSYTGRNMLKKGKLIGQPPSFVFFSLPSGLFPVFLGLFLFSLLGGELWASIREVLMTNLTVLFGFLFFIQGLAVISFYASKFRIVGIIKWIGLLFIIMTPGIQLPVAFFGLLDYGFNFRRIQRL